MSRESKQNFEGDVVANLRKHVSRYDGKAMYNTSALLEDAANYIEELKLAHVKTVADERERYAKIADTYASENGMKHEHDDDGCIRESTAASIADLIRGEA